MPPAVSSFVVVAAAKAMFLISSVCILQLVPLSFARILICTGREAGRTVVEAFECMYPENVLALAASVLL